MKNEFATFGTPARFEVAIRWVEDSEPRSRRPSDYGWSIGDLRITVNNQILTRSKRGAATQNYVSWYLSPFLDWLATNWLQLLHEEDFGWPERSAAPAAVACRKAMDELISATDAEGRKDYQSAQQWYRRHGIRAAAEGGLFPDMFIRRVSDEIELSWSANTPPFADENFVFVVEPGFARFPVEDVAKPLWQILRWLAEHPGQLMGNDKNSWEKIVQKIEELQNMDLHVMEGAFIAPEIEKIIAALRLQNINHELFVSEMTPGVPAIQTFSPAVAMFGGVSPHLTSEDVSVLFDVLDDQWGGSDSAELAELVERRGISSLGIPHRDGYAFADEFLEEIDVQENSWINIREIAKKLEIEITETKLQTNTIRGVAIAGKDFSPLILINLTSAFNESEEGRRFTIAHELCHILHDRSRASRITHVSGPWVAQGFEKRANAFAAYLLMPRRLVANLLRNRPVDDPDTIRYIAKALYVSESALVEHLFNINLINEWDRERLRPIFRTQKSYQVYQ